MIDCYCKVCGLFISIPDEYAGGSGACPRCKTPLRIPKPLTADSQDYVEGQRYIALPISSVNTDEISVTISKDMGPSQKFKCSNCSQLYESIPVDPQAPSQCPACKNPGDPIGPPTDFPRSDAIEPAEESPPEAPEEIHAKNDDTVDGYLVLSPVESDDTDIIIEGVAVDENGNEINLPASQKTPNQPETPIFGEALETDETSSRTQPETQNTQQAAKRVSHPLARNRNQTKPSQNIPNIQDIPDGHWVYFIKGKVAGPVDTQALREMFSRGELSQSVLVWKSGLDGWQSADAFEELKIEPERISPGEISFHDDASTLAVKMLSSRLQVILWMAVLLWSIVILVFLTRKTLESIGIQAYFTCVIVLLSFSLAGLGMGVMLILKHIRSFIKSGTKAFAEWLAAMVAFICAIAVSFSVYTHFDPAPVFENVEHYQAVASEGFDCLYSGNFNDTLNRINWDNFIFNGRDIGSEYKSAPSQKQKMLLIAEVMDQLREQVNAAPASLPATLPSTQSASQPASQPATQPATRPAATSQPVYATPVIYSWMVVKQTAGDTVVMGRCRNGRKISVIVRGGMIAGISIR